MCGSRGLFRRWFSMVERCPRCGFRFEREAGHWVGSLGLNTVISFGALLVTIVTGVALTAPDVAVGPVTAVGVAVAVVLPVLIFPLTRTLWAAVDIMMRPLDDDDRAHLNDGRAH
ncbi:MAG TPA: DUF983 domain-containing protein [Acidimicrobiia bacterium]|nr:DUF983 domain-containing protein [Acidimicrobiia bacterium]